MSKAERRAARQAPPPAPPTPAPPPAKPANVQKPEAVKTSPPAPKATTPKAEKPARKGAKPGPKPKAPPRRREKKPGPRKITDGFTVTGVRLDARVSGRLLDLARAAGVAEEGIEPGRNASLSGIAVRAMQAYAKKHGVALEDPGALSASRRDDADLAALTKRRLWIKFPEAWKPGITALREICQARVELVALADADIWRTAIMDFTDTAAGGVKAAAA